jgi:hypothetical protein
MWLESGPFVEAAVVSARLHVDRTATADMRGNRRDQDAKALPASPSKTASVLVFLEEFVPRNRLFRDLGQFEQEIDDLVFE